MKNKYKLLLILSLVFIVISCKKKYPTYSIDYTIPDTRSFYMGFTPFPYDLSLEALEQSYQNALNNGDIILIHLDNGVPWNEALNDLPFPQDVSQTIKDAQNLDRSKHKLFLTATPTDVSRENLADYWNDQGTHQPLPQPWSSYSFDDSTVIKAYIKYCKRLIDSIHPDYFAYAIEINAGFKENTSKFNQFLRLADTVYHRLKNDYPGLPIFMTFQDQAFNKDKQELHHLTQILLNYSDWIAVSTYPFWQYDYPHRPADPELFPNDWLMEMRSLAPDKPFAVSETGYCAENLNMPEFGVKIKAKPQWQADYVQKLLAEANRLNARFVIWFVYRDYDMLYEKMGGQPPSIRIWRDNGLEDGQGNRRPSHDVWDTWRQLPHVNRL